MDKMCRCWMLGKAVPRRLRADEKRRMSLGNSRRRTGARKVVDSARCCGRGAASDLRALPSSGISMLCCQDGFPGVSGPQMSCRKSLQPGVAAYHDSVRVSSGPWSAGVAHHHLLGALSRLVHALSALQASPARNTQGHPGIVVAGGPAHSRISIQHKPPACRPAPVIEVRPLLLY